MAACPSSSSEESVSASDQEIQSSGGQIASRLQGRCDPWNCHGNKLLCRLNPNLLQVSIPAFASATLGMISLTSPTHTTFTAPLGIRSVRGEMISRNALNKQTAVYHYEPHGMPVGCVYGMEQLATLKYYLHVQRAHGCTSHQVPCRLSHLPLNW